LRATEDGAVQEFDLILDQARLPDRSLASIALYDGRITAIASDPTLLGPATSRENLAGALVIPGLVDGHIHLDKGFIGDRWKPHRPCTAGFDVRERVALEKELLTTAAPMAQRAAALIALAAAHGTTHMRSHVDIDAAIGLSHLETILAVREAHRHLMTIELVAFPQSGILASPGTAGLLDAAIAAGAGVVGGLDPASFDGSIDGHLDVVFGLAERRGVKVDIHLHDPGMLGIFELEQIAARTRALGLAGRVAVSHAYALGDVPLDTVRRTAAILADAGVAIMTNAPGARAFPPVLELRRAGVLVFSGNDNVRDAWWPYGDADMLARAMMVGYRSGFHTDDELEIAFELATTSAAAALGIADYGLRPGAAADFVVVAAEHVPEAVVARPPRRAVYKGGRPVARDGSLVT
jgi:cytosine/creatinine deaminase